MHRFSLVAMLPAVVVVTAIAAHAHSTMAPGSTELPNAPAQPPPPQVTPAHSHASLAIPKGQPVPRAKLLITPDAMSGWNMQIVTENFTFAPERLNQDSKPTEGHAHLFLNGRKLARLYGHWHHIPKLPQGKNELRITLNTNRHEDLTDQGKVIDAIALVEVP
jgi:hypothetical protein